VRPGRGVRDGAERSAWQATTIRIAEESQPSRSMLSATQAVT
jgi:hypothetical protein